MEPYTMEAKKVNKVNPKKKDWDVSWDAYVGEWNVVDTDWLPLLKDCEPMLPDDWYKKLSDISWDESVGVWDDKDWAKGWDVMDGDWEPTLPDDWGKI